MSFFTDKEHARLLFEDWYLHSHASQPLNLAERCIAKGRELERAANLKAATEVLSSLSCSCLWRLQMMWESDVVDAKEPK